MTPIPIRPALLAPLFLVSSAVLFASPARAQTSWPDAYERPRPARAVQPQGPSFSWDPLRFAVAAEIRTVWPQDSGARRVVGASSATGAGVSIHYDAWRATEQVVAKLDLGWVWTSTSDGQSGGTALERLNTNLISLGISARYELFRWLGPYARVAGGFGRDAISAGNDAGKMHDERNFAHGSLGGGLWLRSPGKFLRASAPTIALAVMANIEAGYMLATRSQFALQSSPGTGAGTASAAPAPVPTQPVAIGDVGRNAPYLRVSVGIAF